MREQTKVERAALSVSEAASALGVSRPTMYKLLRRADFPAFQVGARRLISRAGLEHWVQVQAGEGGDT